ncbi:barstar family protein [Actinoallomurus oryzae]|uniref:Barstar family protein n=1 Tax=Actinoallomurus oryzae TaxID=502180 RepID=A0ABP8R7Q2_9ACTN
MTCEANGAHYLLTSDEDDNDVWGYVQEATGLFSSDKDGNRQVRLLGCAPRGSLLTCLGHIGRKRAQAGNANLTLLAPSGAEIGGYFVNDLTVEAAESSTHGSDLIDLTVRLWCDDLFPHSDWVWELIRTDRLNRKGMWQTLGPAGRRAWLSVALNHHGYRSLPDDPVNAEYELDGLHVVDTDSFYCALGEAVNGPGGYFGWNLDALADCLHGCWGAKPPFTLYWRRSDLARPYLMEHKPTFTGSAPLLETLHQGGVDVVMC